MKSLSIGSNVVERCDQDGQVVRTCGSENQHSETSRPGSPLSRLETSSLASWKCCWISPHFSPFITSSSTSHSNFLSALLSVSLLVCLHVLCVRVCVFVRLVSPDLLPWLLHEFVSLCSLQIDTLGGTSIALVSLQAGCD